MIKKSVVCLFIFLLAGCRKDEPITLFTDILPDPPVIMRPSRPMIKTIITTDYQGAVSTQYYYYDTLWRLIKYERHNATGIFTDSVIYYPTYIDRTNSLNLRLSSNGLVMEDDNFSWYAQKHYSYNTDGYLTNEYSMSGNAGYSYNADSNMTGKNTRTEANPPNNIYSHYYYTYNNHINTIGNYNKGEYYFGKSSVNLVEREDYNTHYNSNPPNYSGFALFNYTYNDSGWVSRLERNGAYIAINQIDSVTVIYDTTYSVYQFDYTYY